MPRPPSDASPRPGSESGQATVELVALLPLIAVLGALAWQALVAGQAVGLAGSAARAAARAVAVGADGRTAARAVLPPRLRAAVAVARDAGGGVRVALPVPMIVGGARLGTVVARARFQPQGP